MGKKASELKQLLNEARRYERSGDHYQAVKLYKLLVRKAPDWVEPYERLGRMYKHRGEWKPAFHYTKKALALDSSLRHAWWDLSIAAVAMDKSGLARGIWSKFGHHPEAPWTPRPVSIRLRYGKQFELVWAESCDPVRARIQNIPAPASGHRYGDLVLFDREVAGHHVVQRKRFPVHEALGLYKRSLFETYSCRLMVLEPGDVELLDRLALKAGLGFEVWSNAERAMAGARRHPEYYDPGHLAEADHPEGIQVALAARRESEVLHVLRNWEIICLGQFEELVKHY